MKQKRFVQDAPRPPMIQANTPADIPEERCQGCPDVMPEKYAVYLSRSPEGDLISALSQPQQQVFKPFTICGQGFPPCCIHSFVQ